ncbi:Alpha beta hydrolase fold protein [Seminavis robusta]|uniref:Alpha beta hydrolase fold protein n=1 Tax=Seminavis robusta TaxID=568900 RepID=A0A9N8EQS0_9STRA|nr:Alpha beta hydrolase fold protein [Seminavis robusta]|eukprot:Sro1413_g270560.1 Alpha beta hydrolase fold protein (394) ;mRNA; r:10232-11413
MTSNRSIMIGGDTCHVLLAATASVVTVAASLLWMKRLEWTSEDGQKKRRYFQYKVIHDETLIGPNPQREPVDSQASALFQSDAKESSALLMLTTYSPPSASSANNKNLNAVLIHGFGCTSLEFGALVSQLRQDNHSLGIFMYDRVLFTSTSDYQQRPRDAPTLARELFHLLQARGVSPPYLLIGHSYGGLIAQHFCHQHIHDVQGMVLLDPAHEDQFQTFPTDFALGFTHIIPHVLWFYSKVAWTGVLQFLDRLALFNFPPLFLLSQQQSATRRACARLYSEGHVWQRVAMELDGCAQTFVQMQQQQQQSNTDSIRRDFPPTALVIAGHRQYSPTFFPKAVTTAFLQMHATSLPHAKVFMAPKSDHWIHLQQPEVVMQGVEYVLEEIQKKKGQ